MYTWVLSRIRQTLKGQRAMLSYLVLGFALSACSGLMSGADPALNATGLAGARSLGNSQLRRLNRSEMQATLFYLLGSDPGNDMQLLPEDSATYFDNDYTNQRASDALVQGIKVIGEQAVARFIADTAKRDQVIGCTPDALGAADCYRSFIKTFGRRALRRALSDDELEEFMLLTADELTSGDFYKGIELIARAFLQDLEFAYRVELGTPIGGRTDVVRLNNWEVASRLSFLLWGVTPDDELLDKAAAGLLSNPDQVRAAASTMLEDPRAIKQIERFHAMWLGYNDATLPAALAGAMQAETNALIERVIFEQNSSWLDLLQSTSTFINQPLAEHYGLPWTASTESAWVDYASSGRKGILSHARFLAVAPKGADTSPTRRGLLIRTRLFCQEIPPPPPDIKSDDPPAQSAGSCKSDAYKAHSTAACAGCHSQMDPVGFGLENYDQFGKYRTHEIENTNCEIPGTGSLVGVGDFKGPGELADLMVSSGSIEACVARQMFRFAIGRREGENESKTIVDLTDSFRGDAYRFRELLLSLVGSPGSGYRVVE